MNQVNAEKSLAGTESLSPSPAQEASPVARLISQHLTGTAEHADAVDKLIRENGDVTCIYCAELTLHGLTLNEQGFWESSAKQTMADHMMTCPKRPEKRLLERIAELEKVAQLAQAMLTALNVGDVQKESKLHLKLREVMIAYRAAITSAEGTE